MKEALKSFSLIIICFIGSIFFIDAVFGDNRDCNKDSEMAELARSIPQEKLTYLYYLMEELLVYFETKGFNNSYNLDDDFVPNAFRDIGASRILSSGKINLEYCRGSGVWLTFKGVDAVRNNDEKRKIILSWGELPSGKQTLWVESENETANKPVRDKAKKDLAIHMKNTFNFCSTNENCQLGLSLLGNWKHEYNDGRLGLIEYHSSGDKCEIAPTLNADGISSYNLYWSKWGVNQGTIETTMYETNAGLPKGFTANDKITWSSNGEVNIETTRHQINFKNNYERWGRFSGHVCDVVKARLTIKVLD